MTEYARVDGNTVIERRDIADLPPHKSYLWRPVVYEGDGPISNITIDADLVRVVRSREPITEAHVKAEAARRITRRYPAWKQMNMLARGIELQNVLRVNGLWTETEAAEATALEAAWTWVKAVRTASDQIEAIEPMPVDYADDARWPV